MLNLPAAAGDIGARADLWQGFLWRRAGGADTVSLPSGEIHLSQPAVTAVTAVTSLPGSPGTSVLPDLCRVCVPRLDRVTWLARLPSHVTWPARLPGHVTWPARLPGHVTWPADLPRLGAAGRATPAAEAPSVWCLRLCSYQQTIWPTAVTTRESSYLATPAVLDCEQEAG